MSSVSFHSPSAGPEPVETPSAPRSGLTGSSTGAAGLFKTASGLVTVCAGRDEASLTLGVFVPDEELFVV